LVALVHALVPCHFHRHAPPCDWKASACTPRQHLLLCGMRIDLNNMVCSAPWLVSLLKGPIVASQHDDIQCSPHNPYGRVAGRHDISR
jgi:hypothetical protein